MYSNCVLKVAQAFGLGNHNLQKELPDWTT